MVTFKPPQMPLIALSMVALAISCPRIAPAAPGDSRFPFTVAADQGASAFLGGDQITITEIRGTADQLKPGNTYQIKGKYRLVSHLQASLAADVLTANGNAPVLGNQRSVVAYQGKGDFTLVVPFPNAGQPRLCFTTDDSRAENFGKLCLFPGKFPYVVEFKHATPHFDNGDYVAISEIRSSSSAPTRGGTLQIRGLYHLASLWRARFAAEPSEKLAPNQWESNQFVEADQGRGRFTLVLPAPASGKLQVTLWPMGGGQPVGNVSFQLGKTRLGPSTRPSFESLLDLPDRRIIDLTLSTDVWSDANWGVQMPPEPQLPKFTYVVPFEPGVQYFEPGDDITVSSVRGTANTIQVGGWYLIQGSYTLANSPQAYLAASVTVGNDVQDSDVADIPRQLMVVTKGTRNYTLLLPMGNPGFPHLAFYPAGIGGAVVGTRYFGTGDTVMHKWNLTAPPEDLTVRTSITVTQSRLHP
jgi:hypothetical protein